jgi:2-succinyl-6-hydroxy-2,4-cyclohexadiene-1-carboxylate synthase
MAPALVLLHGFTHTGQSWDPMLATLPEDAAAPDERYRVFAPDIRGHGSASDRQPVELAAVIDDVSALVDGAFTLVGYSMGGRIALHVALALSGRIDRLILISASPGIADPLLRRERRCDDERLAEQLQALTIEQLAARWAQTPVLSGQTPAVAAAARADRLRSTPAGLARALRGLGTGTLPPLWERLGELAMPVTVVVGERDQKFREIGAEMAAAIAGAQAVVVAGAGHAVHLEAPARVSELLSAR